MDSSKRRGIRNFCQVSIKGREFCEFFYTFNCKVTSHLQSPKKSIFLLFDKTEFKDST